ncbi:DUF4199 domain-containing protein [Siphonobacter sp. SORGH_AS_1065]|uniref:DUF4199 domain-containing protein n=1 Tax=Siphonobacter sp. SORGH_AS_1065 TaxID=3041795 RepID=UPI0027874BBC|nr:DUF4199 domain-containing protein [Siphonobacter sp. SORGH_AS_1065]MDQ1087591.1 hypothetical protein [Siphonobacter sp. SORGH_AS_1065]
MEQTPSTARIALKWGAISGIVTSIAQIGSQVLNLMPEDPTNINVGLGLFTNFLAIAFAVFILVMAMREFKILNEGFITYGQGVGVAALSGAVWGVVSATITMVYTQFIDPSIREKMLRAFRNTYEQKGMSDEQIETAMRIASMITNPGFGFVMTIFTGVLSGTLLGLIVAAVVKKDRPVFS